MLMQAVAGRDRRMPTREIVEVTIDEYCEGLGRFLATRRQRRRQAERPQGKQGW
jgi:hypothetical protein